MIKDLKKLELDDMKYVEAVVAEEFGHHAMCYNSEDRFCWLVKPISLPHGQGELFAIGMKSIEDALVLKVKRANGNIYHTNAIEI